MHLNKDKVEIILDKATHTFNNKKKILHDTHQRNYDKINKEYVKEYANFQRSIDKLNFNITNCIFQQILVKDPLFKTLDFNNGTSSGSSPISKKQKLKLIEYLRKQQFDNQDDQPNEAFFSKSSSKKHIKAPQSQSNFDDADSTYFQ